MQRLADDQAILRYGPQLGVAFAMDVEEGASVQVRRRQAKQLGAEAEDDQADG
jgi:hypothetical protein